VRALKQLTDRPGRQVPARFSEEKTAEEIAEPEEDQDDDGDHGGHQTHHLEEL
jgi:hypothetical protein